jgi:hypothetical protein
MWPAVDITGRKKSRCVDKWPLNDRIGVIPWLSSRKVAQRKPLNGQTDAKRPQRGMNVVILNNIRASESEAEI